GDSKTSPTPAGLRRCKTPKKGRMANERQKQVPHIGLAGEIPQMGVVRNFQKFANAGTGALRIANERRTAQPLPKRQIRAVLRVSRIHAASSGPVKTNFKREYTSRAGGAGKEITAGSPGLLSSIRKLPLWRRATAAARESPSPEPGSDRAVSSLTKRSSTRWRSCSGMPGPRSATINSILAPL